MTPLADKKCQSCNKSTPRIQVADAEPLRRQIPEWELRGERLHRRYRFADFPSSIRFVDEMARVAESEGHHPVFTVDFDQVDVEVWTHAIGGLSENDFILAAKLDRAAAS
jgi:4a-hydroxytetrahydrobiopterin dehydratase